MNSVLNTSQHIMFATVHIAYSLDNSLDAVQRLHCRNGWLEQRIKFMFPDWIM